MKIIEETTENEMIALFLKEELHSKRFREQLLKTLISLNVPEDMINNYDLNRDRDNKTRELVLKDYRGYNDKELFQHFPNDIQWYWVELDLNDIKNIKYINYDYWVELSNGTRYAKDSTKNIFNNVEIFGVSNQGFIDGATFLKEGNTFDPIILLASNENCKEMIVLEGHSRVTSMNLVPEYIKKIKALVGFTRKEDMYKWNEY